MKKIFSLLIVCLLTWPVWAAPPEIRGACHMPYAEAGLTPLQASAHLLSRFTFGPRPGQVEAVAQLGPENWFLQEMRDMASDPDLERHLQGMPTLTMSCRDIANAYMPNGAILKRAEEEGIMEKSDRQKIKDDPAMRARVMDFARTQGLHPEKEMLGDLLAQKVVRAVYARNQLREVMTDFWYNHFNVSVTKNQARSYVLSYERDAIRPNVLKHFRDLLGATAKHPAMLYYLDNAQSVVNQGMPHLGPNLPVRAQQNAPGKKRQRGLNENFARELLELHTLGVDGGYKQQDVVEVARTLTGWTAYPSGKLGQRIEQQVQRARKAGLPVVEQGDFVFIPLLHDSGSKKILGRSFPAGRGMEEGEEVLDMLAQHPSTARFIARKIVTRFVSDKPDPALVEKVAQSYLRSRGDIRQVLTTVVESKEFWAPAARQGKIKSPLEYSVSMMRALDADLSKPGQPFYRWLERMGQPLYGYQAPTGFPDRAEQWVNSGTLVNRINFAFALASNKVPGIRVDTSGILPNNSGSSKQRLEQAAQKLLLGRDSKATADQVADNLGNQKFYDNLRKDKEAGFDPSALNETQKIVGVLLSSPEFQRR